ncbi:MAG: YceI family protein [Marinifilaceae bacterium]|jgi:polyisoprenoid-binding protein YceI|nr:YceI family protein [Marinifilaceae bacterium]
MKIYISLLITLCLGFHIKSSGQSTLENWEILKEKSKINWYGKTSNYIYYGDIKLSNGYIHTTDKKLSGGNINIDMNTINNKSGENSLEKKLISDSLVSQSYFDTANYPDASLFINRIVWQRKNKYKIKAEIKIKDFSRLIDFYCKLENRDSIILLNGEMLLDRTDFFIRVMSEQFFYEEEEKDDFQEDSEAVIDSPDKNKLEIDKNFVEDKFRIKYRLFCKKIDATIN